MASKRGPKTPLTKEHKAALAVGRTEGKVVRDYLDALRSNKPKRGRKRTAESIKKRLAAIEDELQAADAVKELKLIQERMDLESELNVTKPGVDVQKLETAFIKIAKGYSARSGISYAAWRQVGVAPSVLAKAGISRGS